MPVLDLQTRIIPADHKIFALHAGKARRYVDAFFANNAVFLELPGFGAARNTFQSIQTIRRHLRMSDAIREYYIRHHDPQNPPAPPSRNSFSYDDAAGKNEFNLHAGAAKTLYEDAKPGDLILVPGGGATTGQYGQVYFGELVEPFNPNHKIQVQRFGNEDIPFRLVKWLPARPQKRDLPESIARRLENPQAITEFNRFQFGETIYRLAYANYTTGNSSKADFFGPGYSGRDPLEILEAAQLIKFFVSAYAAIKSHKQHELGRLSAKQVIDQFFEPELLLDFTIEFTSPGKFTLIGKMTGLALFVSAAIALAGSNLPYETALNNLPVTNSIGLPNDPVVQETQQDMHELMQSLGADQYEKMKEMSEAAKEKIDLSSKSKIEP